MIKRKTALLAALVVLLTGAAGFALVEPSDATRDRGRSQVDDLQRARAFTARFHSLQQAEAAGYVPVSPCIPGEGIHYERASLVDNVIDPEEPELLLYAPRPNGELRLVGIEYFKPDADNNLGTAPDRPSLFGVPFDGPMFHPGPPIVHYDLHVWLWEPNPNGMFVLPNPNVTC